jgi:hypothetical protein
MFHKRLTAPEARHTRVFSLPDGFPAGSIIATEQPKLELSTLHAMT